MKLLESVVEVNTHQPQKMIEILKEYYPNLEGLKVAVLGMAFKPGTDDIRESPAIPVTQNLLKENVMVTSYDPIARHEAEKIFGDTVEFYDDLKEAIKDVSAILIITRWQHFEQIPEMLKGLKNPPLVIDGRRMLDKNSVAKYAGIGLDHSNVEQAFLNQSNSTV
jgi:UDPglucose 6-dehydrogenase/GDP-mannose 6-dehydrogenase